MGYVTTAKSTAVKPESYSYTNRREPRESVYRHQYNNPTLEGETATIFNGAIVRLISWIDEETASVGFPRKYLVNRAIDARCSEEMIRNLQSMKTDNSRDEIVMEVNENYLKSR